MARIFEKPNTEQGAHKRRLRNALLFVAVAAVWLAFDQISKAAVVAGHHSVGQCFAGPFLNLFQFTLVHNTGGAWGIFGNASLALAVFSIAVCVAIAIVCLIAEPYLPLGAVIGFALVFSGGIGNAIDRIAQQYVTDFIEFTFIDFPVFNIADIGVTCGMVLAVVSLAVSIRRIERENAASSQSQSQRNGGLHG